jgi:AcrR family transcriptional regulator
MTADPASRAPPPPAVDAKAHRRQRTAEAIQRAIAQLQGSQSKVSISAVAKVAGVSPALLHNTYPDLAEQIRGIGGKTTRAQRDAKQEALVREKAINRGLRREIAGLKGDLARLASINQTLLNELAVLKGVASGKVVSLLQSQPVAG